MPPTLLSRTNTHEHHANHAEPERGSQDGVTHVTVDDEIEHAVAGLHRAVTAPHVNPAVEDLEKYLQSDQGSPGPPPLSVCFKSVTTYGRAGGAAPVKTLKDAIWRTLTLQEIYELTFKNIVSPAKAEDGQPLIRDFSGVVRNGQMMLVLGNPGSGCSTFLRTIGNDHKSFLNIKGSIDYSGLSPQEVSKNYRGLVTYIPEDDLHLPTLTVRQTLDFALRNKTPKRWLHQTPRFIQEFGKAFGMTHVMDTLVGNEYIRGVSGGERKRVSILESLASDASVNAWDGSTRGLDASSAVDFIRSLRIMTDACHRATAVSLYQASDAICNLMDKVLLIDKGRMLYQGPIKNAEAYFNSLGYERLPRQTLSDFLTSVASGDGNNIRQNTKNNVPRGAENLEKAFRESQAFQDVQDEIKLYEAEQSDISDGSSSNDQTPMPNALATHGQNSKSRFVRLKSSYNTSFFRQVCLCAKRDLWQLKGHKAPFISKYICIVVCAFLLASMFYNMPADSGGVYSRGGFCFYSSALVAWFQLAELDAAFHDRMVVSRQKRYAMVRPCAVVIGKAILDVPLIFLQSATYAIIAYFLSGLRMDAGPFFIFLSSVFLSAMGFTASYRVFGAISPQLEVALRYCGVYLIIAIACGGYVRSVGRMIADVPWVGWLAYLTPVPFAYENIMSAEFRGRSFPCESDSIIPKGSNYNDSNFQACASKGSVQGRLDIDGSEYLRSEFGFSYANIGRNYGILLIFTFGFLLINMLIVEHVDWVRSGGSILEYARRRRSALKCTNDEETIQQPQATGGVVESLSGNDPDEKLVQSGSTFTWRNIGYTVPYQNSDKQLLRDVSGFCEPGKLTALVGASGAGKSTLLTVLTQQANGTVTGEMRVDDQPVDPSFGSSVGYCQQMDIHVETSTVREAFEFSALLRQSASTSDKEKRAYVDKIIGVLGMNELQDMVIGSLSLEQKKRTTIGVELCAKPNLLLFLDEPTSGLDSQGSISILRLLRRLADGGQAIVCTIHQASQEHFDLFDRVLALSRGGRVYYFGPVAQVVNYFSTRGVHVSAHKNVADLLIEIPVREKVPADEESWADVWTKSSEAAQVLDTIDTLTAAKETTNKSQRFSHAKSGFTSSTLRQTTLLTHRTLAQYWRTPNYVYSRLYACVVHAALNGLIFLQLNDTEAAMQYRIFSAFLVLMIVPEIINATAMMFDENRNIWLAREYPSRIYGWTAFTTAQIVAEVPFALAGGVLFYVLVYFLVGFPLGVAAGYTFLMFILFQLFITSWGQWIAALSAGALMAANIMPFFVIAAELFNGILQPASLMPAVWRFTLYYVGPFTYWISGTLAIILPRITVQCADSELIRFDAPPNWTCEAYAQDWLDTTKGYLANPDASSDCGYCQYASGEEYLSTLELEPSDAWPYLGVFVLFTVTNYMSVYVWVYLKSVKRWLP
ncbi:P-loop containing nucleoside triphosphate hydrolase protein [Fusarium flagelliforme]|uniref:P-loop containing nucleoside triphosphate hydrolase protein n=1 Tax=Fusarium flagelliforme TaxID=2675880 RepID=UPI001E8E8C04|nr:P-loop containing nucleoside triphosphate hydrolase protein [Fusarium flagelliforme]KAH7174068.1 P-loop containing nucleoside triphosphate hydrolase protein [Fusarium flagelliforme]